MENEDTTSKEAFERLLNRRAEESPDLEGYASMLTALGITFSRQFEALGRIEDAEKAISCQHLAIKLTSVLNPDFPNLLGNLGNTYFRRFVRFKEDSDFNEGTTIFEQAISLTPTGHPDKPGMLNNLGGAYLGRFDRQNTIPDIEKALNFLNQAVDLTPDRDARKPGMLHNLGRSYCERFHAQGQEEDFEMSIQCMHKAIALCTDEQETKADVLDVLTRLSRIKFERSDNLSALENAIAYVNQAVMLTPIGRTERPVRLGRAGDLYRMQFDRRGKIEDAHNAVNCLIQAISLCAQDDQDKFSYLNNLGIALQGRYGLLGRPSDINDCIRCLHEAIELTPDSNIDRFKTLHNLGNAYQARFNTLGDILDIDQAINCGRLSVEHLPEDHQVQPSGLHSLGSAYFSRYQRLSEISDLDEAIKYMTLAVSRTSDGDSGKPGRLNSLGLAYQSRFRNLGDTSDIDDAVNFHAQANDLTPNNHAEKPQTLANLGRAVTQRFERQGGRSDIDLSIELVQRSIALTPQASSILPHRLEALGNSYKARYIYFGNLEDSVEATRCYEKAVLLIPDGHLSKPTLLLSLGDSYYIPVKHNQLVLPDAAVPALKYFRQAAESPTGDPRMKFVGAGKWAFSAHQVFHDHPSSMLGYQRAIDLLPELVWLGVTVAERYTMIKDMEDIIRQAAAFAISIGSYNKAIEWLEEGRSIVWNQTLQLRTPLEELSVADPTLAARIEAVNIQLEQASTRGSPGNAQPKVELSLEQDAQNHRQLAFQRDELLNQARGIPGFENYMRPQKATELIQIAEGKVVVIVNAHSTRCDALIIRPGVDQITHVPLESFSLKKALDIRVQLASLVGNRGTRAGGFKRQNTRPIAVDPFKEMLGALWTDLAKPILASLDFTEKRTLDELPHVTWCTTGPLSFLPLHAAGCYDGQQPNVSDLVVSSYIPTLSALLALNSQIPSACPGILTVGQEHTPGFDDLPSTVPELAAICNQAKLKEVPLLQLDGNDAKVANVLQAMNKYGSVHLACHASQDANDPTRSAFHLRDGGLTLAAITKKSFKDKGLAFLSACQTATGDEGLPDEAIHLAAGMLMAGYPGVVATMWSINDEDAPEIAQLVYGDLLEGGQLDHRKAARALHKAAKNLREKIGETSFARWVPFIHMGV